MARRYQLDVNGADRVAPNSYRPNRSVCKTGLGPDDVHALSTRTRRASSEHGRDLIGYRCWT
jgi:hypothetical protein